MALTNLVLLSTLNVSSDYLAYRRSFLRYFAATPKSPVQNERGVTGQKQPGPAGSTTT
jgi:hypothetical protein